MAILNMAFGNIRNIVFGNIRNMASVNTLIKKGYLLAGVLMAVNMFVVNEVRASEEEEENNLQSIGDLGNWKMAPPVMNPNKGQSSTQKIKIDTKGKGSAQHKTGPLATLLRKNDVIIPIVVTFALACFNNYYKLWDYKPGEYAEFGCLGARSENFLNGIFQIDTNFNLGKGLLVYCCELFYDKKREGGSVVHVPCIAYLLKLFFSVNLIVHIPKFIISISLDTILRGLIWLSFRIIWLPEPIFFGTYHDETREEFERARIKRARKIMKENGIIEDSD